MLSWATEETEGRGKRGLVLVELSWSSVLVINVVGGEGEPVLKAVAKFLSDREGVEGFGVLSPRQLAEVVTGAWSAKVVEVDLVRTTPQPPKPRCAC